MKKEYKALGFEIVFEYENDLEEDKIKDKSEKKNVLNNEDIPYEVRMKYIIDAYRKDQEKWSKLYEYTKHLEKDVIRLKEIIIVNGYTEKIEGIEIKSAAQIATRLRQKIKKLKDEKRELETKIRVEFPDRRYNLIKYMKAIRSQDSYIKDLQNLLDEKGIPFDPQPPIDALVKETIEKLDENGLKLNN